MLPNPPDFSLFSYSFLSPRSDKTLQDIVYKLVPGLFKGTSMDNYNCVGLGLFVTRSHPPVKLVPWGQRQRENTQCEGTGAAVPTPRSGTPGAPPAPHFAPIAPLVCYFPPHR